ncbi:Uncharacterized protein Adt_14841 [Abeliophyllum distichum]|uniref:Uncharacterized protein n=1 Tax=Abeliophyllum distichum TaxID=126358 RepID=A0ABD1U0T2_9LAMI
MKFLTLGGVTKIHGNQIEARACYINALRKAAKCEEIFPVVMMVQTKLMDVDLEKAEEEMILYEGLDLQIIGCDSSASPTEELEAFFVNPSDPTQMLQLGQ